MNKYYYTFAECFNTKWNGLSLYPDDQDTVKGWYQQLRYVDTLIEQHGNPPWIDNQSDTIKELCLHYIKPIMYNYNVYFLVSDTEYDLSTNDKWKTGLGKEALNKCIAFIQKIYTTKDKYEKLIDLQTANINSIISDIEQVTTSATESTGTSTNSNTGINKRNDTPQAFGSWTADYYVSDVAQNTNNSTASDEGTSNTVITSKTSLGSLADKLEQAERALTDYYERWANEVCTPFKIYC